MNGPLKPILIVLAALAGAWLSYSAVSKWYLQPRRDAVQQIEAANTTLASHHKAQQDARGVSAELQSVIDRTLGPNLETVDHRLRSRLNRLAEQAKLQGVSVGTEGGGTPRLSPARGKFRASSQKALRDEIDFIEVEAWISGVGGLEDVVRLITAIEAESWIKRIDQVRLDPRDNGARVALSLRLTTLFLPGREPNAEQPVQQPNAELQSRFAALVSGNPFRVPPPPAPPPPKADTPQPAQPAPPPPPPPPFPFAEWALTGVAQGPHGPEAWLRHQPSGETRVLTPGQGLDTAIFNAATADADAAEFSLGEKRFIVVVGATMDQRTPVGQ